VIGSLVFGSSTSQVYSNTLLESVKFHASILMSIINGFYYCTSLQSITIPNSVTSIERAFNYCWSLKSITIPNSVTSIHSLALNKSYSLQLIIIEQGWCPNGDFNIGDQIFLNSDAIVEFFNRLGNAPSTIIIVIGTTNLNKLTPEEIAIATNKGYTLA
jgi:hypothetical protein